MAADVPVNPQVVNSCCATWKQKCSKLEKGRNALREAVHFLQQGVERAQAENSNLKKALEEERAQADIEKEVKEKASAARLSLENEISRLKSEISVKPRGNVDAQYKGEINLLKAQVSDRDKGEMENPELCPKWIALLTMEKACLSTISLEGNDIVGFPAAVLFFSLWLCFSTRINCEVRVISAVIEAHLLLLQLLLVKWLVKDMGRRALWKWHGAQIWEKHDRGKLRYCCG